MRIEIKNFGPIDHLEFDLEKDIHLIYGQNSIGKSYAIYVVYLLLKNLTKPFDNLRVDEYIIVNFFDEEFFLKFKLNLESLYENETLDITKEYNYGFDIALDKTFAAFLKNSFLNTFSSISSLHNQYVNKKFEIILHNSKDASFKIISNNENDIKIIYTDRRFTKYSIKKESSKYGMFIDDLPVKSSGNGFSADQVLNKINNSISLKLRDITSKILKKLHFLPASRSGLYQGLNSLGPIMAELSKSRHLLRSAKIELPTLSEPVSDYYLDMSTVDKNNVNVEFQEMVDFLQKEVLKGEVHYDDESKKIYYSPEGIDIKLELSESSSMISELSPLVIYLKHIINNKFDLDIGYSDTLHVKRKIPSILFIEEPEAHLHPEIQVKLMELFTKLPKYGIKIFITSHSNYMFNKLNNMLIKKEVDSEKVAVYHLVKEEKGTIDKKDMEVTEDGVNDENFQEITEQLYYERLNYLEDADDKED